MWQLTFKIDTYGLRRKLCHVRARAHRYDERREVCKLSTMHTTVVRDFFRLTPQIRIE